MKQIEQIYEVKVILRSLSDSERTTKEMEERVTQVLKNCLDEDVVKVTASEVYKGTKDVD